MLAEHFSGFVPARWKDFSHTLHTLEPGTLATTECLSNRCSEREGLGQGSDGFCWYDLADFRKASKNDKFPSLSAHDQSCDRSIGEAEILSAKIVEFVQR